MTSGEVKPEGASKVSLPADKAELQPCPFCGGEAYDSGVARYHKRHEAWFADGTRVTESFFCGCVHCGITNKGLLGHQTPQLAVESWNTRTATQIIAGLRAELAEAKKGAALYEKLRRLNPRQFTDLHLQSLDGAARFDDLVAAIKESP